MVEFAIILPLLLTFFGAIVDFSRVYTAWINLQSAARNAAEYVATNDISQAQATIDGKSVVCTQITGHSSCSGVAVTVTWTSSTTAPGASVKFPIATAHIHTVENFAMLFPYPLLPDGRWPLAADYTFNVAQGR